MELEIPLPSAHRPARTADDSPGLIPFISPKSAFYRDDDAHPEHDDEEVPDTITRTLVDARSAIAEEQRQTLLSSPSTWIANPPISYQSPISSTFPTFLPPYLFRTTSLFFPRLGGAWRAFEVRPFQPLKRSQSLTPNLQLRHRHKNANKLAKRYIFFSAKRYISSSSNLRSEKFNLRLLLISCTTHHTSPHLRKIRTHFPSGVVTLVPPRSS
ncbi:hypothetical protein BDZ97DRAFT_1823099 [Flammula alnicola]|nr:hypothetical protein BDZ97DRAFT_1823099 [Flammula alnicola]